MKRRSTPRQVTQSPSTPFTNIECEVLPGLQDIAYQEICELFGDRVMLVQQNDAESLRFKSRDKLAPWLRLRTVVAAYLVQHYSIARPKALLGHQNFQQLLSHIQQVQALYPAATFRTFRISAAGDDSTVFTRIKQDISQHTGLAFQAEEADLVLRVRPAKLGQGWEVLTRLSPRPLITRSWRMVNMAGALNAVTAAAMIKMTQPQPTDRFLNVMCGSGTLLIERLIDSPAHSAFGIDYAIDTLYGARHNLLASRAAARQEQSVAMHLLHMDVTALGFADGSFDVISGDLPWGHLVGSAQENAVLYPRLLAEIARVATRGARIVLITQAARLMEHSLPALADKLHLRATIKTKTLQGGVQPRIYVLERT